MESMGIESIHSLLDYYWRTLFGLIDKARPGTKKIVWQEVLDMKVNVSDAIAHVWKGNSIAEIRETMANVTAAGHHAILSNPIGEHSTIVIRQTSTGPTSRRLSFWEVKQLCGENTWTGRILCLACGPVLLLWLSGYGLIQTRRNRSDKAWPRLHEFRCRVMNRGFAALPPNAPDYCPFEWNPVYKEL
ncbi:hypothetical protein COOONC_21049 [Cooperia oncophora]